VPTGYVLLRRDGLLLRAAVRRRGDLAAVARRYRRFPAFTAPAALLNVFAGRVPVFGLAVAFGPGPTGLFGLAFATLALPVGMVTAAVGQVFFVRAAEAHRRGALGPLARQVHARLAVLASYPILAAAVAGPPLFALVFGAEWAEAGQYARFLAPWLLLSAVAPPLARVFDVTERQREDLAFSTLQAVGVAAALALAARGAEPVVAVAAAGAAGAVVRAMQLGWALRASGAPVLACAGDFAAALLRAAPFLAAGYLAGRATGSIIIETLVLAAGGLGFYAWSARADRRGGVPVEG
jgi:O-antigen/teichoic acid export membrane protein